MFLFRIAVVGGTTMVVGYGGTVSNLLRPVLIWENVGLFVFAWALVN